MNSSIDANLLEIVQSLFGDDITSLKDTDGPETIEAWDSAGHLNLVTAVEMEFGVQFDVADFATMTTIGEIRRLLLERLGQ